MAIFGNLDELPFPDVIGMLGRRSGHLNITTTAAVTLHIDDGHLLALYLGPQAIHDAGRVREVILELTRAERGSFEFKRIQPNDLVQHHHLALNKLLLSITAVLDELAHYRTMLPAPETRFQQVRDAPEDLDASLKDFLDAAAPSLLLGASAAELAPRQGLHLERAQLYLYKLRALGLLTPVRAYPARPTAQRKADRPTVTPPAPPSTVLEPSEPRGLIGRLLAALHLRRKVA
ncbi:DUF4388 domain-containing protein [Deinococcus yavapaiensis]|uniref:Uncharacterized protein DUF4388 n=1 Tax=Deinococcus yavapaiensis KR-236 TaxID=694435 RepID=A0A318S7J5_9DEIO|nr:DUF4388 domain-containing protein [Deinococcus yavapaiensis]PYE53758.1 uncharacterized protein DUF4388 [Deinococcus yavapaiensis KR-236]